MSANWLLWLSISSSGPLHEHEESTILGSGLNMSYLNDYQSYKRSPCWLASSPKGSVLFFETREILLTCAFRSFWTLFVQRGIHQRPGSFLYAKTVNHDESEKHRNIRW